MFYHTRDIVSSRGVVDVELIIAQVGCEIYILKNKILLDHNEK